jgi:hypothetical protein
MIDDYTPEEIGSIFDYLRQRDAEMKKAQRGS